MWGTESLGVLLSCVILRWSGRWGICRRARSCPPGYSAGHVALRAASAADLIYTGITRGNRLLVGPKKALGVVVRNDRTQRRYSGLLASLKG